MSRLTNSIREQMARKLVNHRYHDEGKELVRLDRTLAERVYNHCYTPAILASMAVIEKAFPNTFNKRSGIGVNAGGMAINLGAGVRSKWVSIVQEEPVYRLLAGGYYSKHDISGDAKLTEDVAAFAIRAQGFDDVCHTAYSEAMSVLNTMTTGKKLAEAWPEAMEVIGDLIPEGERTLPVVQVSAINAKFKLPPKKFATEGEKRVAKKESK